jgi:hypothetical protein
VPAEPRTLADAGGEPMGEWGAEPVPGARGRAAGAGPGAAGAAGAGDVARACYDAPAAGRAGGASAPSSGR